MVKDVPYNQYLTEVDQHLKSGGLFLTTKGEKVNTMVIGWGGINIYWGKPIFIVPVRKSRYSHNLLEKSGEFTVSVPLNKELKKALAFCGSKSGRDFDKFQECGLTAVPGRKLNTPIVGECTLHYECKTVYKQDMIPGNLDKVLNDKWYPDYHTFYYGEIVACYVTEE